jgi:hypothetical protein
MNQLATFRRAITALRSCPTLQWSMPLARRYDVEQSLGNPGLSADNEPDRPQTAVRGQLGLTQKPQADIAARAMPPCEDRLLHIEHELIERSA